MKVITVTMIKEYVKKVHVGKKVQLIKLDLPEFCLGTMGLAYHRIQPSYPIMEQVLHANALMVSKVIIVN